MQMEQELERLRQQGVHTSSGIDHLSYSGAVNSGIVAFEMEYGHWVEEQNKQVCELRNALNTHITDIELQILVDTDMKHYFDLFHLKATAAKADVFYLMSGMWKTSAERFFLWIGGFRPSELLKIQLYSLGVKMSELRYSLKSKRMEYGFLKALRSSSTIVDAQIHPSERLSCLKNGVTDLQTLQSIWSVILFESGGHYRSE